MRNLLRFASLLLALWSFSASAVWREMECFPPVLLNRLPTLLLEQRPELSLDWSGLPYLRRHKDYQVYFEAEDLGGELGRYELFLTLDGGRHRFGTQILPRFHKSYDAHLVYMGGSDWREFMLAVPPHNPYFELFRDGAIVFSGTDSAYIIARNYQFLSICVPLPRRRSRESFDEMVQNLFRFINSPRVMGFLSCEGVLAGLKERT